MALVANLRERLQEVVNTAEEVQEQVRERDLRPLRDTVAVWLKDRLFIESKHPAFHLLLGYSQRAEDWRRVKGQFRELGSHVEGFVEKPLSEALTRPNGESRADRQARWDSAIREMALQGERIVREFEPLESELVKIRALARADLLRVL